MHFYFLVTLALLLHLGGSHAVNYGRLNHELSKRQAEFSEDPDILASLGSNEVNIESSGQELETSGPANTGDFLKSLWVDFKFVYKLLFGIFRTKVTRQTFGSTSTGAPKSDVHFGKVVYICCHFYLSFGPVLNLQTCTVSPQTVQQPKEAKQFV